MNLNPKSYVIFNSESPKKAISSLFEVVVCTEIRKKEGIFKEILDWCGGSYCARFKPDYPSVDLVMNRLPDPKKIMRPETALAAFWHQRNLM